MIVMSVYTVIKQAGVQKYTAQNDGYDDINSFSDQIGSLQIYLLTLSFSGIKQGVMHASFSYMGNMLR